MHGFSESCTGGGGFAQFRGKLHGWRRSCTVLWKVARAKMELHGLVESCTDEGAIAQFRLIKYSILKETYHADMFLFFIFYKKGDAV